MADMENPKKRTLINNLKIAAGLGCLVVLGGGVIGSSLAIRACQNNAYKEAMEGLPLQERAIVQQYDANKDGRLGSNELQNLFKEYKLEKRQ